MPWIEKIRIILPSFCAKLEELWLKQYYKCRCYICHSYSFQHLFNISRTARLRFHSATLPSPYNSAVYFYNEMRILHSTAQKSESVFTLLWTRFALLTFHITNKYCGIALVINEWKSKYSFHIAVRNSLKLIRIIPLGWSNAFCPRRLLFYTTSK